MNTILKEYFPVIRKREEILQLIEQKQELKKTFYSWTREQQTEFLDMCSGVKGVKLLYDAFFKEIMNPEYVPERLNDFLSLILNRKVKVNTVLPNDSTRITDEMALLITDIVVELEDGSLANIEVQKIGYYFPGQRCACYSADLLLRQYRRIRDKKKKKFSYKDIKNVYTIVLFERSTSEFHEYPDIYRHIFEQKSDTGLSLPLLQKYILIPLDIFRENLHNKGINNKLDAWLTFICEDDPEVILRLIKDWPEFKPIYEEIYHMCLNIEGVMNMFSRELQELDRNTVQYMIDDMKDQLDLLKKEKEEAETELETRKKELEIQKKELEDQKKELEDQKKESESYTREIETQSREIESQLREIESQSKEIESQSKEIELQSKEIESQSKEIEQQKKELESERLEKQRAYEQIARLEALLKQQNS